MRMVPSCVYKDCLERPLEGRAYCAKHRPGAMPTKGRPVNLFDLVKADLDKRNALGWATYRREMLPENDVDWLQNLYEELLDSCMYVKGELLKRAKQEL